MNEPRAYTPEEVRDQLLEHLAHLVDYWSDPKKGSEHWRMTGLLFSMLSTLDGCSMALPGFLVTPMPHPADREYHQSKGENWYPEDQPDLGMLHEQVHGVLAKLQMDHADTSKRVKPLRWRCEMPFQVRGPDGRMQSILSWKFSSVADFKELLDDAGVPVPELHLIGLDFWTPTQKTDHQLQFELVLRRIEDE